MSVQLHVRDSSTRCPSQDASPIDSTSEIAMFRPSLVSSLSSLTSMNNSEAKGKIFVPYLNHVGTNEIGASMMKTKQAGMKLDDPQYQSYAFPSTSTNENNNSSGWFAGLRAKIAQLTGVSEWMNQLGLKEDSRMNNQTVTKQATEEALPGNYDESTICFRPIVLDDFSGDDDQDLEGCDTWDFGASFLADLDSNYKWNDTLERQHFGPLKDLLTAGSSKTQSHNFVAITVLHPTWCDKCGDFVWGLFKTAIKCENCNYTCHERCKDLVTLDCRSAGSSLNNGDFPAIYPPLDGTLGTIPKGLVLPPLSNSACEPQGKINAENPLFTPTKKFDSFTLPRNFAPAESPTTTRESFEVKTLTGTTFKVVEKYVKEDTPLWWTDGYKDVELTRRLQNWNATSPGAEIVMNDDGTYHGHIQVHMNFSRPISVVQGEKPPTVYDVINTAQTAKTLRTITSFFLPRNTVKTINIDSKTTTRMMIVALLRKFRVADNPRKFALYECEQSADEKTCTIMRKMTRVSDDVCPLKVVLGWDSPTSGKALVLQENDTGDILWDAFEIPELENFLRILGMEERQYVWQINQKYSQYRYHIDDELRRRGYSSSDNSETQADRPEYPTRVAPSAPKITDEYGTSDSMIISEMYTPTMKRGASEDPEYENLEFWRQGESTRL